MSRPDNGDAILALIPGALFTLHGDDLASIEWYDNRPLPSGAEIAAKLAELQARPKAALVDGAAFLARLTDEELSAIDGAAADNARINRWFKTALMRGDVDVHGAADLAVKAELVKASLLSQQRADAIFAPS